MNVGERTKGKMRPRLPRSSDARAPETDEKPTDARGAHGHFAPGNRTAMGSGLIVTTKKLTGDRDAPGEARIVARDARRVAAHVQRALPSDAAPVRVLVAIHARHVALNAYYTAKAETAGLDTPEGLRFLEVADRQSQRAERVLVTAQDMARVCAAHVKDREQRQLAASIWIQDDDDKESKT